MKRSYGKPEQSKGFDSPTQKLWDSGFTIFKRRIGEQLQLGGFDGYIDDDDLLPFYRSGENETFVLSALGCSVVG